MSKEVCDLCGNRLAENLHFIVTMDVYADPSLPATTSEELKKLDFAEEMGKLMDQMKDIPLDDLQDQVHRHFDFKICAKCHPAFLANPLGKPRGNKAINN